MLFFPFARLPRDRSTLIISQMHSSREVAVDTRGHESRANSSNDCLLFVLAILRRGALQKFYGDTNWE